MAALWLGIVAVLLALVTAWAGGELVERLGVGVGEGAHLGRAWLAVRPARGGPAGPYRPVEARTRCYRVDSVVGGRMGSARRRIRPGRLDAEGVRIAWACAAVVRRARVDRWRFVRFRSGSMLVKSL